MRLRAPYRPVDRSPATQADMTTLATPTPTATISMAGIDANSHFNVNAIIDPNGMSKSTTVTRVGAGGATGAAVTNAAGRSFPHFAQ